MKRVFQFCVRLRSFAEETTLRKHTLRCVEVNDETERKPDFPVLLKKSKNVVLVSSIERICSHVLANRDIETMVSTILSVCELQYDPQPVCLISVRRWSLYIYGRRCSVQILSASTRPANPVQYD